jgi:hypothetical protein
MELNDSNDEICAREKRSRSVEATSAGGNSQKEKRKKLVARKNIVMNLPLPSIEIGENEGAKGGSSSDSSSDDASDDMPNDVEEGGETHEEKKAKKTAEREKFWLEMKHSPIQVRQETSKKGRSIKYLGNRKYTITVVPFERNGKGARVFTSCVKAVRSNLAKDKAINIVPGMMCKVAGDAHNMFMIHSIELYLAHPHR